MAGWCFAGLLILWFLTVVEGSSSTTHYPTPPDVTTHYPTPPDVTTHYPTPPDPSLSCSVDGKIVANGDTFTTQQNGPCFTYRCVNRAFSPIEYKCPLKDKCIAIGTNITTSKCIIQQCQHHGQSVSYSIVQDGCSNFANGCTGVNEVYKEGCTTYTCQKRQYTYHMAITGWGCKYGDMCLQENDTITTQCVTRRCEKRGDMVGLYAIERGCQFIGAKCLKTGEYALDQCRLYTCKEVLINGVKYHRTEPVAAMCKDYKGGCHKNGADVEMEVTGGSSIKHVKCKCIIKGIDDISYKC